MGSPSLFLSPLHFSPFLFLFFSPTLLLYIFLHRDWLVQGILRQKERNNMTLNEQQQGENMYLFLIIAFPEKKMIISEENNGRHNIISVMNNIDHGTKTTIISRIIFNQKKKKKHFYFVSLLFPQAKRSLSHFRDLQKITNITLHIK